MTVDRRTLRLLIAGRVQGVGYRDWTRRAARDLGLSGWVRNLSDGRVEAVVSGEPAAVDRMMAACRKGPAGARVDRIETTDGYPSETGPFERRPTL